MSKKRTRRRVVGIVILIMCAIGSMAGCSCSTRAPEDGVILYYTRGASEGNHFSECLMPSTKGPGTVNDVTFQLPTNLRTWSIQPKGGDTDQPLVLGSRPDLAGQAGPQVKVWGTAEFYLNTYCGEPDKDGKLKDPNSPAVLFWEKLGRRYGVSTDDGEFVVGDDNTGFKTVLLKTIVPVINRRASESTRAFWADELDNNMPVGGLGFPGDRPEDKRPHLGENTWTALEADISQGFQQALKDRLGGEFFCGNTYKTGTAECPAVKFTITDITYADQALQDARAATRKATETAKQRLIEAQNQVDVAAKLSQAAKDSNYMRLKELETQLSIAQACAQSNKCTLVVPNGTGVITSVQ
jgi:hypothetical protein